MRRQNGVLSNIRLLRPEVIAFIVTIVLAAVVGYILAGQIIKPNKRVIEVAMGLAVLIAAWLLPNRYAVGFMIFIIPFPKNTTIGSTTVIFAFIIFAFWILKLALGYEKRPVKSGLEIPILVIVLLFFISMKNVQPEHWRFAVDGFRTLISSVFIFFLVVNLIRNERDIQFVLNALLLSFAVVCGTAIIELWVPQLNPYIAFLRQKKYAGIFDVGAQRVGGVIGDAELFAEYVAIFIPILLLRVVNEKIFVRQVIWGPFLVMGIMLLLASATRGAFISLIVGIIYLVWIAHRIINFQKFLPVLVAASIIFYVSSIVLNQYTASASLFARLGKTRFVSGMPDTRARAWSQAWERMWEHPWIGHGPYHPIGKPEKHIKYLFPHSLPLWLGYMVGVPGILAFYTMFFMALRRSYVAAKRYAWEKTPFAYTVVLLSSTIVIFLVDEVKISFMRWDKTQHFTWTLLALLAASSRVALMLADERDKRNAPAKR